MLVQARKTVFWQFLYPDKSIFCNGKKNNLKNASNIFKG